MIDWINKIHVGDCRQLMRQMIANGVKVQTVVTSPPYFGLRDYGTAKWVGGDSACTHVRLKRGKSSTIDGGTYQSREIFRDTCSCGAKRIDSQIGLERSPHEYVQQLVDVFDVVWQLLASDGTVWLNLGDSYCSTAPGTMGDGLHARGILAGVTEETAAARRKFRPQTPVGMKPKDLMGIPWAVAFALRDAGWYLRSDIIWNKPNPMPESVTDRPTKAHEYLFLLSKAGRYYYDSAAICEQSLHAGMSVSFTCEARKARALQTGGKPVGGESSGARQEVKATRNRRSVWTVPTSSFRRAHFATFPIALIEPCILAGSRPGNVVFDPFMGSGTTAQVAESLGRNFIGCELNADYAAMYGRERAAQLGMGLA